MSAWRSPLLVFGGTFDPVHLGHLAIARHAADLIEARCALVLPCADPPHRAAPLADVGHRAAMLRLAFADDPRFAVDLRETRRPGPSYSVDTLAELRAECGPEQPIVLLLGRDAAHGLPGWHRAGQLAGLCHVLVLARPGGLIDRPALAQLGWTAAASPGELGCAPAGLAWAADSVLSEVSSTWVREALTRSHPDLDGLLPAAVRDYIATRGCYLEPGPARRD